MVASQWSEVAVHDRRTLIDQIGPRHENMQEAEGGRVYFFFLNLILIKS